jgi:hypothetical protein
VLEITTWRKIKMNNFKTQVMLLAVVLIMTAATGIFAQTVTTTPINDRQGVIDTNGDGICDITGRTIGSGNGQGQGQGQRKGPGDGTGNGGQQGKQMGKQGGTGSAGANCTGRGRSSAGGRMNRGSRR